MSDDARKRATDGITSLVREHLDVVSLWRESSVLINRVLPNYMGPCWYTLDPASLLITSHVNEELPEFPSEWLQHEYYDDDVNTLSEVARSETGISTLYAATGGQPSRSPRWTRNSAYGGDQEMVAALRTRAGQVWGAIGLYREAGQPMFDEQDLRFIRTLAPQLAEGARRALLVGDATEPDGPDSPGLVVLSSDWQVESTTPGVERWLADLPDGDWPNGRLPSAVISVAARAKRLADHPNEPGGIAMARVLSRSRVWVVLHGVSLVSGGSRRVAVIVEPAHPARISPLLMSVYGLTEREQDVTQLVLQGNSTVEIAGRLIVSENTVQQHLKSVFDKTGVRSRRDLIGKVFFAHYEPRVRDNEQRTLQGRAIRGGPVLGNAVAGPGH